MVNVIGGTLILTGVNTAFNGSVVINESSRWYSTSTVQIRPGDTIVVPLNAEHLPLLPLWQAVTQIIYNVAIAAAAVHSF